MINLLSAYGVGRKQSESHKQNQNPGECHIQEIKGTTRTVLDGSGAPSQSWLLFMVYVVSIPNFMARLYLSWITPH